MKLLLIPPQPKERKFTPRVNKCAIPKVKLYKAALKYACEELTRVNNNSYSNTRNNMIRKAKQLLNNQN